MPRLWSRVINRRRLIILMYVNSVAIIFGMLFRASFATKEQKYANAKESHGAEAIFNRIFMIIPSVFSRSAYKHDDTDDNNEQYNPNTTAAVVIVICVPRSASRRIVGKGIAD